MSTPWAIAEMTLDQAETEYARYRARSNPSTADLRRESELCRHIEQLRAEDRRHRPIDFAPVAQMRELLAGVR
jgi:hypothetical protein